MISVNFTCQDQKLAMNSCLRSHGTMDEQDRAREEWFATRLQKKREAAEQESERLQKIYAERQRLENIEERTRQRNTPKSSWWPLGGSASKEIDKSQSRPDTNSTGNGG